MPGERRPAANRIAMCSPDQLRRDAMAAYLETLPDFTVVGRVADGPQLVRLAGLRRPDIGVIDAGGRVGDWLPTVRLLRKRFPAMRLVLVYERLGAPELAAMGDSGVAAVVPYAHGLAGLLSVLRGLPAVDPPAWTDDRLTARQRDVLLLLASGHQVREIAQLLHISPSTVENHKHRMYAKFHATSAVQAIARAAHLGIIDGAPVPHRPGPADPPGGRQRHPVLTVVAGQPGPVLDECQTTLISHRIPVVWESPRCLGPPVHWPCPRRGPVVGVLVNPAADQCRAYATLGWSAILVHDGAVDPAFVEHAVQQGVTAALRAEHVGNHLVPVLNLTVAGYLTMDPRSATVVIDLLWARTSQLPSLAVTLTAREHDILRSIGLNHTVRQTARTLGIATKTVENAQGHLFRKLGVHNRAAALAKAYALGLLQPEPP
jgi:DNA-binding NarL/FixJ family response regulator